MRVWGVWPAILCKRHLLGEHFEIHMFIGNIRNGKSLKGYIENGLVEVHNLKLRHEELVKEMEFRGGVHKSPFPDISLWEAGKIDVHKSLTDLTNRCFICAQNIKRRL